MRSVYIIFNFWLESTIADLRLQIVIFSYKKYLTDTLVTQILFFTRYCSVCTCDFLLIFNYTHTHHLIHLYLGKKEECFSRNFFTRWIRIWFQKLHFTWGFFQKIQEKYLKSIAQFLSYFNIYNNICTWQNILFFSIIITL